MWEVRKFGSLLYSIDSHDRRRHQVHSAMARGIFFDSHCEIYVQKYLLWHSLTAYLPRFSWRIPVFSPKAVDVEFQRFEVTTAKIRLSPAGRTYKFAGVPYSFIDIARQHNRPIWDRKTKEISYYHDITNMSLLFFFKLLLVILRIFHYFIFFFFSISFGAAPPVGHGLLIHEDSRLHTTDHSR